VERADLEEKLAQLEQGLARGLALLESGQVAEAQALLSELTARPLGSVRPARSITDDELEMAFADAEPELEQMRDADQVAQQAILEADRALEAEGDMAPDEVGNHFATETMASLLEQQGDGEAAQRIRSALVPTEDLAGRTRRPEAVATLERWLDNLRRGAQA